MGINRTRPPRNAVVTVTRYDVTKHGIRVYRRFSDPVTGEVIETDTFAAAPVYTWPQVEAELSAALVGKLRTLPYKLMGATNAEADAAAAADDME